MTPGAVDPAWHDDCVLGVHEVSFRRKVRELMRLLVAATVTLASLSVVGLARAEPPAPAFGSAGQSVLSADRLLGISAWSTKVESPSSSSTVAGTAVHVLWSSGLFQQSGYQLIYAVPRVAFDYAFVPGVTVGTALGYFHRSASTESATGDTASSDQRTESALLISPRVGYAASLGPVVRFWVRGGVTYVTGQSEQTSSNGAISTTLRIHGLALAIDPQLVVTPVPHFGITLGPVLDFPLWGKVTQEISSPTPTSEDYTVTIRNVGFEAGLLGYF